jgi:glycosyltransferase involved in cell wall biosynthesis
MLIDDGSTDRTIEVARQHGIDHVVALRWNQGYGKAWAIGLEEAIDRGADIIVNTDGDNQYCGADVATLCEPIVRGQADIVIGTRPIDHIRHWSPLKRFLQKLGSAFVRTLSRTPVEDAPSGFRAMTRDAALRIKLYNDFSPSLESLIQAGRSNLRVVNVPIRVNGPTRPSRLMKSMTQYIRKNGWNMVNAYMIYRPTRLFGIMAAAFLVPSLALALRYVWLAWVPPVSGGDHLQSVILAGALLVCGVFTGMVGFLAHLLAINRRLLEEIRYIERARRADERARRFEEGAIREPKPPRAARQPGVELGTTTTLR